MPVHYRSHGPEDGLHLRVLLSRRIWHCDELRDQSVIHLQLGIESVKCAPIGQLVEENAMSGKRIFLREATGMIREYGWLDAFALSNSTVGPIGPGLAGLAFYMGYHLIIAPNGWLPLDFFFGLLAAIPFYWTMVLLSTAMPRSGGDYVYVSRILHPALGFMNSFVFAVWSVIFIGISLPYAIFYGFAAPFYFVGMQTGNPALLEAGLSLASPWPAFTAGTLLNVFIFAIVVAGRRAMKFMIRLIIVLSLAGMAVMGWVMATHSQSQFIQAFNQISSQTNVTYQGLIDIAKTTGWQPPRYTIAGAVVALPIAFYTYYGSAFAQYYGGEVKNFRFTQMVATLLCMFAGFIWYVLFGILTLNLLGDDFYSALSYLGWGPGMMAGANPFPVSPGLTALANIVTVPTVQYFVGATLTITYILWFMAFYMYVTRSMFAWSFDRVGPELFARVSDRLHTPVIGTFAAFVFSEVFCWIFSFTTFFYTQFNAFLGTTVVWILPSLAGLVFPYRRKDLFQAAPPMVRRKIAGVPLVSITGAISLIVVLYAVAVMLQIPYLGPLNPSAFGFFISVFIVGLLIFYARRAYLRTKGVDIDFAFKEIPPE